MSLRQFDQGYWKFLKKIQSAGGVPCEQEPEIFFPEDFPEYQVRQIAIATAKRLCKSCPIKADCLEYAIETNQRYGIWAGTTATDRTSS